jgi:hypothetical protein
MVSPPFVDKALRTRGLILFYTVTVPLLRNDGALTNRDVFDSKKGYVPDS